jgi:ABC-type transporter Mla subunit MlaD
MKTDASDIERLLRVPSAAHRQVLGWFFILLALVAVAVLAVRESDFLRRNTGLELIAFFRQGHSLRAGSKVLLAEVQIGEVQSVMLFHDPMADTDRIRVQVRLQIKGEYARALPVGTEAEIRFGALEFANSVVLVPPDTPTAVMLVSGALIPARGGTDLIEEARTAFAEVGSDLRTIVANLKMLSDGVTDTHGDYRQIMASLVASTGDAELILSRSRSAFMNRRSAAGVLLNEDGATVRQIERTFGAADRSTGKIESMTDTLVIQMDTVTAIAGNLRRGTDRLPVVMTEAEAAMAAVQDAAKTIEAAARNFGASWLFGGRKDTTPARTSY